ncbi:MAG: GAF domain-containing protein [Alistipes sp.]|nr:GAF domain-containing protein [Alistipes sp.]
MAEELQIAHGGKDERYDLLHRQVVALTEGENDDIANMANIAAMIHATIEPLWTGFYRVIGDELVLGPFQGPMACSRIKYGKGVCGTAWECGETLVVEDVEKFPGHIACSSLSRSEIVVPVWREGRVVAVLDIDSAELASFDDTDKLWLERIVNGWESEQCKMEVRHVALRELLACVPASSNYTFTTAPDSESRDYDDNLWNDLVSNLIDFCGGDADRVAKTFVNHFDAEDNYIASYALELTDDERAELEDDCEGWRMEEM